MNTLLDGLPLPVIGVVLVGAFVLASLLGSWLWRPVDGKNQSDIGYIVSGSLGLLALLIGFTFAVALDRYATRRDLVIAEANSIEVSWLRADLLGGSDGAALKAMLSDYAQSRLKFAKAGNNADELAAADVDSDRRQRAIWGEVTHIVDINERPVMARAVVDAVSTVIGVAAQREAAARANIPPAVIRTLLVYALINSMILGFALGGSPRRHRYVGYTLFVLLALAVTMILDLDQPARGAIRVSQQPMDDLISRIALGTAPVAPVSPETASPPPISR
jgi:hypothetical protein